MSLDNVGIIFRSRSTVKIIAKTGPRGEPIATPSTWRHVLLLIVKCAFLVQLSHFFLEMTGLSGGCSTVLLFKTM